MEETLFEELKRYVDFGPDDEAALRALHPVAMSHYQRIAEVFYDRILTHEGAKKALRGGESQVGHLKVTLTAWMERLLQGPWDESYYETRCLIGRVHVRIGLPQHYMFGAMNILRRQFNAIIDAEYLRRPPELAAARRALSKILDLELAIMLHTYREDLLAERARLERLSTFGQLVGSIGHDLRNPLGVMETSLFILKNRVGDDERSRKHLERIGEQLGIANGIISNLLDMIRDRPLSRARVQLADVVGQVARSVRRPQEVALRLDGLDQLPEVDGDPGQLRQVFVNLIENAVYAAAPQGEVALAARRDDGLVEVAVEDTGPGVDQATRLRLFEPLITTKEKGIGLGLALVKRIVERHGGTVAYESRVPRGARFLVRLPVAPPPQG